MGRSVLPCAFACPAGSIATCWQLSLAAAMATLYSFNPACTSGCWGISSHVGVSRKRFSHILIVSLLLLCDACRLLATHLNCLHGF
jgi:hypothetical protein